MTTENILQALSIALLAVLLGFALFNVWQGVKWAWEQRKERKAKRDYWKGK